MYKEQDGVGYIHCDNCGTMVRDCVTPAYSHEIDLCVMCAADYVLDKYTETFKNLARKGD